MHRTTIMLCAALALTVMFGCASTRGTSDEPTLPLTADGETSQASQMSTFDIAHKVIFYFPNRALDVTDMVSLAVALPLFPKNWLAGFVHANVHATRAFQVGAGNTNEDIMVGLGYKRQFMPWFEEKYEISGGPFTFDKHKISRGNNKTDFGKAGIFLPTDEPFANDLMDYWAVGAEATVLPVGVQAGVHPVEIADAVLGFFFIDVTGDDL